MCENTLNINPTEGTHELKSVRDGCAQFISEEKTMPLHYQYVGAESLSTISKADIRSYKSELLKLENFRSELSMADLQDKLSSSIDGVRESATGFMDQLDSLSRMIKMLSDTALDQYLTIDGRFLADLLSQALMALKLIAAEPSVSNLTLVFTCCITKLQLDKETYEKIIGFITRAVESAVASVSTLGYKSEGAVQNIVNVMTSMCDGAKQLLDDKVIDVVVTFLAKLVAFWTTISGGFSEDDFRLCKLDKVVSHVRTIFAEGGDIVEALMGTYEFVTSHFAEFIRGDFSAMFMGKAETSAYESRVTKVTKSYTLLKNGSLDILKEEYGFTPSGFDAEVSALIKLGDRFIKKAKDQQKPALKRMLDELREVATDRAIKQAQTQSKMSAVGVCFVGGSGVGKSLLMEQTAKTLIAAAGEVPSLDRICTGQMSDKFDSNELPSHLVLMYDDVANNSNNENFDKLLNAVNSQSRPFLKASVEEKGVMFPGNVGCVISTNVLGYNAQKSNCPDSLGRRFLHIVVSIKEHLKPEVCVPGTNRVDTNLAMKNGPRMDIWKFDVYEFVTFDNIVNPERDEDGAEVEVPTDPDLEWVPYEGRGMTARRVHWTSKSIKDYTYWDLALYLGQRAKKHFSSQQTLLEAMNKAQNEELCAECCIPASMCACHTKSEFICPTVDLGIDRVISNYNTFLDYSKNVFSLAKFRLALALSISMCPINIRRTTLMASLFWLVVCFLARISVPVAIIGTIAGTVVTTISVMLYAWRQAYRSIATRAGILSHLACSTAEAINQERKSIFTGVGLVSFAYLLYRAFRPKSQLLSYREQLPENIRTAFVRAEKAKTTPIDQIMPHMKRDLGRLTVTTGEKVSQCLAFPITSNCYITAGHILPEKGEFEVTITHENALNPTVHKQKLSDAHVYRFEGKDLAMMQIPSAIPRRGYLDFLNGRPQHLGTQAVQLVSMDLDTAQRYTSRTRMEPGWTMMSSTVRTDRVKLTKPYRYSCPSGTKDGMCGSLIVDYSKSLIYGFHIAGNGSTGLCSTISRQEIEEALSTFKGFLPANQGDLQLGSQELEKGLGFAELKVGDSSVDKEIEEHNCVIEGILPGASATFKDPYMKHPYHESVVREFGESTNGPPQQVNHDFHKRKALSKLSSPNQEFSLDEVEHARLDYVGDIVTKIKALPRKEKAELSRKLTLQEALDGISEKSLGGIDNSTSVGFPYKGKKMNYLARDPLDETLPLTPRELVECNGIDIKEEVQQMVETYKSGKTVRPLFKCSMKTNELLPKHKFKARVFMGSNFPFLLVCRMYLAPFIRLASRNKYLFESAKGINMDSVEAEELYTYLSDNQERTVALDYSAFDQTMSVQVSSAVSSCIMDIMRELGCDEEHLQIARGILTDINYPNLHFFGTILQLANSDPSGNPITTELNGGVNSIYLRIFFYRIYPELKGKVSYRQAIKSMTYGDDNISSVPEQYSKFNGTNIVAEGKKVGLTITMADKDAAITDFTPLSDSDFLKRKFRYCPDMGRVRAPLAYESITKSLYYMKKTSPDPPEVLFAQNVDGALRKASQHGRDTFETTKSKLLSIAQEHDVTPLCKWWGYNELIEHDKKNYYDNYRGHSLADVPDNVDAATEFRSESRTFESESFVKPPPPPDTNYRFIGKVLEVALALVPAVKAGRFRDIGMPFTTFFTGAWILALLQWIFPFDKVLPSDKIWWSRIGVAARDMVANLWLNRASDIIRPQPYCIVLEGPAGSGKTTLALLLIKELYANRGGIKRHEIVVLNEEDDFQSEYRSHHKVVILDDVGNARFGLLAQNPLRRVIDFVNNIPKRALSPEADMKGVVKIQPELVVVTSNLSKLGAYHFSNCPDSIYRRGDFIVVKNKKGHVRRTDGLDTQCWTLAQVPLVNRSASIDKSVYKNFMDLSYEQKKNVTFDQLSDNLSRRFDAHSQGQERLVEMVNDLFDEEVPTLQERWIMFKNIFVPLWSPQFKSEDWNESVLDACRDLPRGCGPDVFLATLAASANEQAASGNFTLDEMPLAMRLPEREPWYERLWYSIRQILGWTNFKSEQLTTEKRLLIMRNRKYLSTDSDYIVHDDYVIRMVNQGYHKLYIKRPTNATIALANLIGSVKTNWHFVDLRPAVNITYSDVKEYDTSIEVREVLDKCMHESKSESS